MKGRTKRILSIVSIVVFLIVLFGVYRENARRRMIHEAEMLMMVEFGVLDLNDLTFDQALQQVAEKVRESGHRELQLQIYPNPRKVDHFKVQEGLPDVDPKETHSVSFLPGLSLGSLLRYLSDTYGGTCVLQGHTLVGVHARGTFQPFEKATLQIRRPWAQVFADQGLRTFAKENGVILYEGMELEYRQEQSEVVIDAPQEQIDSLSAILDPIPSKWQRLRWRAEGCYDSLFRR